MESSGSLPGTSATPVVDASSLSISTENLVAIINQTVAGAVSQAIGGVKTHFDKELATQKFSIETSCQDLEKLKKKKDLTFKGNLDQEEHNSAVLDLLEQAVKLIRAGASTAATPIIEKAIKDINFRNKLVRFADKSPSGWAAVQEYLVDDLASDSDDEKRMRAAQSRADAKKKKASAGRSNSRNRSSPYGSRKPIMSQGNHGNHGHGNSSGVQGNFRGPSSFTSNNRFSFMGPRPSDVCFACQKPGHWRRNCPGFGSSSGK